MEIDAFHGLDSDPRPFWKGQVAQGQASGLNQSQYCWQQGLGWHTFHYRRKKLTITLPAKVGGSRLRLVPLTALEGSDVASSRNPGIPRDDCGFISAI